MKKNHPHSGKGIAVRVLGYSVAFIAVIGIRETLTEGTGPVNRSLGQVFNRTLMATSKLGLGVALMNQDQPGDLTVIGEGSKMLGRASHKAFVSAAKVDLYAR